MTTYLPAPGSPRRTRPIGWGLLTILGCVGIPFAAPAEEPMTLKYRGRYESQPGADHMQDVAVISDEYLAVVSGSGVTLVDRQEIGAGTTSRYVVRYQIRRDEPSNLDGAPPGGDYIPKFFHVASYPPYLYVSSRFDGVWIFRVDYDGKVARNIVEVGRLMRPREFTEGIAVLDDRLYLTHHADGIEVLDLRPDPASPVSLATLAFDDGDAWGIEPQRDDTIWVADGRGGVKLFELQNELLTQLAGENRVTSPGTVFDLAAAGNWVVAAVGGQGVTIYEKSTALQMETFPMEGVCVDIKPVSDTRVVVSCRSWVHVLEVTPAGQVEVLASTRLHRRVDDQGPRKSFTYHLGAGATYEEGSVYVAGWDHLDAFDLLRDDPDDVADVEISGQRAQFGELPTALTFEITNAGEGLLELQEPSCAVPSLTCVLGSRFVDPGQSTSLEIRYGGGDPGLYYEVDLLSNDPGDSPLRVQALMPDDPRVDPGDPAPDFSGRLLHRDYRNGRFVETTTTLSEWARKGKPVHFAIFGTWCPACIPAVASMTEDIFRHLPRGSVFFLVNPEGQPSVLRHVLEKIYIPIPIFQDDDGTVNEAYAQQRVGLPFGRGYVIDPTGTVTMVATGYSPAPVLEAIEEALP